MTDYQCSLTADGQWHATQEQAAPPAITRGGAFSTCSTWLDFKRGFERRRPTCPECLRACEQDEQRRNRVNPSRVRRPRPVEEEPVTTNETSNEPRTLTKRERIEGFPIGARVRLLEDDTHVGGEVIGHDDDGDPIVKWEDNDAPYAGDADCLERVA